MLSLSAYDDFKSASSAVLNHLYSRLGFQLWMVTRTEGEDWIVLSTKDEGYDVKSGDVFRWTDSFCSRMVRGEGPRIAPRSDEVPAYAEAPIGQQVDIAAYIGVPLVRSDGTLFGTLCAIDPQPMSDEITSELPLIELLSRMLTTVLEYEFTAQKEHRRAECALVKAMTDSLTGLYNRRGWDQLLATEDARCQRYGHPASILSIDLDYLKIINDRYGHSQGDELLCRAAEALKAVARESDVVARLGGDEFAMLAVECDYDGTLVLMNRLEDAMKETDVSASIGMSMRNASGSLADAFEIADQRMYDCKKQRKAARLSIDLDSAFSPV